MKNIRLQYAAWEQLPPELQAFFAFLFNADAERGRQFYELYFLWFNIPHEIAHVLRAQHGLTHPNHWHEETAVTAFAAAYWRQRGEKRRLETLRDMLAAVVRHLPDPVPAGQNRAAYFHLNYASLATRASAFAHFMFGMALEAIDSNTPWFDALRGSILPEARDAASPPVGAYAAVNALLPPTIVEDIGDFLRPHAIHVPDINVECAFSYEVQFVTWE